MGLYTSKYTGPYQCKNPQKYRGDASAIVYRSLLERQVMVWFDNSLSVLEWSSEEIVIPYLSEIDGKIHRYFCDFAAKIQDKNGNVINYLIEVKPHKFTKQPTIPKHTKSKRYINEVLEYVKNQSKWTAAEKYCAKNNMKFLILTEKDING